MLWSLKTFVGTHGHLFHKPWATSPLTGLELGEELMKWMVCPMKIDGWPAEDLRRAREMIIKIKELGWIQ